MAFSNALRSPAQRLTFLRTLLAHPARIGAIAPSGPGLARLITSEVDGDAGLIVELGPGTGVFTRELCRAGVPQDQLLLVETEAAFVEQLQRRYPAALVLRADAARLARHPLLADVSVGGVISGLPLLNMSPRQVMMILSGAFSLLKPAGAFYQFTYRPRSPVPAPLLDRLGLTATRIGGVLLNAPPAWVYRIARAADAERGVLLD